MAKPPLNGVAETEYTKSHQRERSPLFDISSRVHELVARAMRGKCVRHRADDKVGGFMLSATAAYHACEHSARKSRADSCTHCLHARIYRCGGRGEVPVLTGRKLYFSFLLLALLGFLLVGVGASTTRFYCIIIAEANPHLAMFAHRRALLLRPARFAVA